MSITQTVEVPPSHRLTIDVPPEVQAGPVILTFTPKGAENAGYSAKWKETLAVLERTKGAWAANPWLTALEDIRADRDACMVCDPLGEWETTKESHIDTNVCGMVKP